MLKIFDTHTHFNDEVYKEKEIRIEDMIEAAKQAGVKYFCCVGFDLNSSKKATKYCSRHESVYAAVGFHPNHAHEIQKDELIELDILANSDKVVAIGEIGLDYYYTDEHKKIQKEIFREQIKIAQKYNLAVMLHLRDKDNSDQAYLDAIKILKELDVKVGVVHCFTRGYDIAKKFINIGFKISIPGVVTFKKAVELQDAVTKISINDLVVETDAPYLTPEPFRGKLNKSQYIVHTVEKIAKLKNMEAIDVSIITTKNAKKLFNLNK